ncbi:hypothetical protein EYF80_050326 [Liparis tanakae]|uniref:Uncharacterized protein n=1 Tax=Liparis tanakae TaxID=230148 RepID=A0A4Z2FGI2_9TELE|nr:hypothetical protein EYF80_050326 [Liparis tanakae]
MTPDPEWRPETPPGNAAYPPKPEIHQIKLRYSVLRGQATLSLSSSLWTSRLEARQLCSMRPARHTGQKSLSSRKQGVSTGRVSGCRQMWHTRSSSTSSRYRYSWFSSGGWAWPHRAHRSPGGVGGSDGEKGGADAPDAHLDFGDEVESSQRSVRKRSASEEEERKRGRGAQVDIIVMATAGGMLRHMDQSRWSHTRHRGNPLRSLSQRQQQQQEGGGECDERLFLSEPRSERMTSITPRFYSARRVLNTAQNKTCASRESVRVTGHEETRTRGDEETRRRGHEETGRRGDKETGRRGDEETRTRGDGETRRRGDGETRRRGEEETGRGGDEDTRRRGHEETRRGGHEERRTRGDEETRRGENAIAQL